MLLARQTRENTAIQRILEQLEQGIFREVSGNFRTRTGTYQALQRCKAPKHAAELQSAVKP
jgi:hypothetical protein